MGALKEGKDMQDGHLASTYPIPSISSPLHPGQITSPEQAKLISRIWDF